MELDSGYFRWLETRPPFIRALATEYPPGWYIIKEGAPYAVSAPGTKVYLNGYNESGEVSVVVTVENRPTEANAHLERKLKEYGNLDRSVFGKDIEVLIDPVWLEPVEEKDENSLS